MSSVVRFVMDMGTKEPMSTGDFIPLPKPKAQPNYGTCDLTAIASKKSFFERVEAAVVGLFYPEEAQPLITKAK